MPDVRTAGEALCTRQLPANGDRQVAAFTGQYTSSIAGARVRSPNKVVWGHGAAVRASQERQELKQRAVYATLACVPPKDRDRVQHGQSCAHVTLTRQGPRMLDDDNWIAGAKPIRDGVAYALGVDDADDNISFRYRQERTKVYGITVRVEVHPL